jgi:hypothetical protein
MHRSNVSDSESKGAQQFIHPSCSLRRRLRILRCKSAEFLLPTFRETAGDATVVTIPPPQFLQHRRPPNETETLSFHNRDDQNRLRHRTGEG